MGQNGSGLIVYGAVWILYGAELAKMDSMWGQNELCMGQYRFYMGHNGSG